MSDLWQWPGQDIVANLLADAIAFAAGWAVAMLSLKKNPRRLSSSVKRAQKKQALALAEPSGGASRKKRATVPVAYWHEKKGFFVDLVAGK
jgi:hypothetical protein